MLRQLIILLILVTSGCAHIDKTPEINRDLDQWLDQSLIPFMIKQLQTHPRIKQRPLAIVAMKGDHVQPNIDDFSRYIRQRLQDGIQQQTGTKLIWKPAAQRLQHHRSLEQVRCDATTQHAEIQLAVDVGLMPVTRELRVAVSVVDLAAQEWVSGLTHVWHGPASSQALAAMKQFRSDEYLRGLRSLPFSDQQADLLAQYLAHNLSCLLRQTGSEALTVYSPKLSVSQPQFFQTTHAIVDNYLSRFNEIRLSEQADHAEFHLKFEIHALNDHLYQVWARLHHAKEGRVLGGTDTESYVQLTEQALLNVDNTDSQTHHDQRAMAPQQVENKTMKLNVELVTPSNALLCKTDLPWLAGKRILEEGEVLPQQGCFGIEVSSDQTANIAVIALTEGGEAQRLVPSRCDALGQQASQVFAGELLRLPAQLGYKSVLEYDRSASEETVFVLAASTQAAKEWLAVLISTLPDVCEQHEPVYVDHLAQQLTAATQSTAGLTYVKRSFRHR